MKFTLEFSQKFSLPEVTGWSLVHRARKETGVPLLPPSRVRGAEERTKWYIRFDLTDSDSESVQRQFAHTRCVTVSATGNIQRFWNVALTVEKSETTGEVELVCAEWVCDRAALLDAWRSDGQHLTWDIPE